MIKNAFLISGLICGAFLTASANDCGANKTLAELALPAVMAKREAYEVVSAGTEVTAATNWDSFEPGIYSFVVDKNQRAYVVARAPKGVKAGDKQILGTHRSIVAKFQQSEATRAAAAGEIHLERIQGRVVCTEVNNKSGTYRYSYATEGKSLSDAFALLTSKFKMPLWENNAAKVKRDLTAYFEKLKASKAESLAHTTEQTNVKNMLILTQNNVTAPLQKKWLGIYEKIRLRYPHPDRPSYVNTATFTDEILEQMEKAKAAQDKQKLTVLMRIWGFVKYSDPDKMFDPASALYSSLFEGPTLQTAKVQGVRAALDAIENLLPDILR